jgi:hypothetical protein
VSGRGLIAPELPQKCEMCGAVEECRPYGPNGEQICFDCGMKDKETTHRRAMQHIFGEGFDA